MQTRRLTGIVLAAVAALVLAACEPAPPPWTGDSPSGSVDTVTFSGTSVKVQGWAGDRNTSDSIRVVFLVDGTLQSGATVANGPRPDVARATGRGGASGYARTLTVPGASTATRVCVIALNVGPGDNSMLGCRTAKATGSAPTTSTTTTSTTTTSTTTSTTMPASTVDQENFGALATSNGMSCPNSGTRAQTFTAGRTGTLDKVSLSAGGTSVAIDVKVVTLDGGGGPSANVIGSGSYTGGSGEIAVTMTTPAEVQAGTAYAIVMSTSAGCSDGFQLYDTNDNYAAGSQWTTTTEAITVFSQYPMYDFRFRTWVR